MSDRWRIYYAPGLVPGDMVEGSSAEEWRAAPAEGVQVVVFCAPYPSGRRPWVGDADRQIWTGDDFYDPFGFGVKLGLYLDLAAYEAIWRRAFYEPLSAPA